MIKDVKTKKSVIILIAVLVLVVLPIVVMLAFCLIMPAVMMDEHMPDEIVSTSIVIDIGPILANITGTDHSKIFRIYPHLVLSEDSLREYFYEIRPNIKDKIILAMRSVSAIDLDGEDGMKMLKKQILYNINKEISAKSKGLVVDVYFSEFLIQ